MFNDDIHVVLFDNVVNPDTFNDDNNVDEWLTEVEEEQNEFSGEGI